MQGGEQRILFLFTFKEPGLYVFGLNTDANKMLVLRVMEHNKLCRANALLPQLRTAETLAVISARLPTTLTTGGWSLFVILVATLVFVTVLVFTATWTLTRQNIDNLQKDLSTAGTSHRNELSAESRWAYDLS